jgi:hypothetical protein
VRAIALIAVLALLWDQASSGIALSLHGSTPGPALTFLRLALGALILVPIVLVRRLPGRGVHDLETPQRLGPDRQRNPWTLFGVAQQTVPSSLAGVINATTPLRPC